MNKENSDVLYKKAKTVLLQGNIFDSLSILRRVVELDPIYKEIIKKEMLFNRLIDNPLFKEIIRGKTEFDRLDEEPFNRIFNKTKIIENKS
jgi:hypothetical protein